MLVSLKYRGGGSMDTHDELSIDFINDFKKKIFPRNLRIDDIIQLMDFAKEHKIDINRHDPKSKYTLLHYVITKTTESNQDVMVEILDLLFNAGADVNKRANDSIKNTPIHTAARRGLPAVVKWLIERGVNTIVLDANNKSPLDHADVHRHSAKTKRVESMAEVDQMLTAEHSRAQQKNNRAAYMQYGLFGLCVLGGAITLLGPHCLGNDSNSSNSQP